MTHQEEMTIAIKERRLYMIGTELPKDWFAAFNQWLPLAESGGPKAQFNIGRCFDRGDGVEDDKEKALEWYLKAASQEDPRAYYNLFLFYEEKKDQEKSKEYFDKALALNEYRALAQAKKDEEKAEQDKLNKERDAAESFKYQQGQKLEKTIKLAQSYMKEKQKQKAYELLKSICEEEHMERVKKILPFFKFDYVSHKFFKIEEERGNDYRRTIRDGNLVTVGSEYRKFRYNAKIVMKNNSNEVINFWDKEVLPGEKKEFIAGANTFEPVRLSIQNHEHGTISSINGKYEPPTMFPRDGILFEFAEGLDRIWPKPQRKAVIGCFVLTACYGDENHPVVLNFRKFRDEKLLTNKWGTKFVKFYYEHAPTFADYISDKPVVKKVFRGIFKVIEKLIK